MVEPVKGNWYHREGDWGGAWKAVTGVVTRKTGIAFVRDGQVVRQPYVTLRRGDTYIHLGRDKWDELDGEIIHLWGAGSGVCEGRDQAVRVHSQEEDPPEEWWDEGHLMLGVPIAGYEGNSTCPVCRKAYRSRRKVS